MEARRRLTARVTREQLAERIAAFAADFVGFAALLDVVTKEGVRIKIRPSAMILAFEAERDGWDIVLKPRQVFMTTWELARDIWYFLVYVGARVGIICQSDKKDRAINEVSDRLTTMIESLRKEWPECPIDKKSSTEWTRSDDPSAKLMIAGAGASADTADKVFRGAMLHRLHITELAFFEYPELTLNSVNESVPRTAPNSEFIIESTANGAAGPFFEKWQLAKTADSSASHKPTFLRWLDHYEYCLPLEPGEVIKPETKREAEIVKAGATPEQLKWYRFKATDKKGGGQSKMDQEYPVDESTCWLVDGRVFFDREKVITLRESTRDPAYREFGDDIRIWKKAVPGREYVIPADPSEGTGGDPGAALVYDRATGEHVATLHGQFPTREMGRRLGDLGKTYNYALLAVERNNHGVAVLDALAAWKAKPDALDEGYPNIYFGEDGKAGFWSSATSRTSALEKFEEEVRSGFTTPDLRLVEEMLLFIVKDGKPQAARGAHDDLVLAAAIGRYVLAHTTVGASGGSHESYDPETQGLGF